MCWGGVSGSRPCGRFRRGNLQNWLLIAVTFLIAKFIGLLAMSGCMWHRSRATRMDGVLRFPGLLSGVFRGNGSLQNVPEGALNAAC